jgi:hypothetical protein
MPPSGISYCWWIARVNMSPGQNRDLDRPLVEVDPNAPPHVRWAQRALGTYVWTLFVYGVAANFLLLVTALVLLLVRG